MKKWIWGCVVAAVIVSSVWFYQNCYLPEFQIMSTVKTGCDNYSSVYLSVVVNRWFYDKDEIMKKVREYYCELNVEPERLDVRLYNKSRH